MVGPPHPHKQKYVLKREEEGGSFKPFSFILNLGGILYQIEASYYALCLEPFKIPMVLGWVKGIPEAFMNRNEHFPQAVGIWLGQIE